MGEKTESLETEVMVELLEGQEKIESKIDGIEMPVIPEFPTEMKISNLDEIKIPPQKELKIPKSFKINNFPKFPESFEISNPTDFKPLAKSIDKLDNKEHFADLTKVLRWDDRKKDMVQVQIRDKDGKIANFSPIINVKGGSSGGGSAQYSEGAKLANVPTGTLNVYRRDDTLSTLSQTEGQAVGGRVNSKGAIWFKHDGEITVNATDLDIRELSFVTDSVEVLQSFHDNLNTNANLQIADTDVATGNPVPTLEVAPSDFEGAPVTVGTTAVAITFSGTTKSVSIQSDPDNTGKIWVGKSNITNTGGNAMKELSAGQSFDFEYDDSDNAVYVISDTVSQNIFKFATL